jgi:hypothetical protein
MSFRSKISDKINPFSARLHLNTRTYLFISLFSYSITEKKKHSVYIANTDLLMVYGIFFAVYF